MAGLLLKTGEILKAKQPASLRGIGVRPDRVEKQFKLLEYPPCVGFKTGIAPFSAYSLGYRVHVKYDAGPRIKVHLYAHDEKQVIA